MTDSPEPADPHDAEPVESHETADVRRNESCVEQNDAEPAADAQGWRPISEAPKDGRLIDVWTDENKRKTDVYWEPDLMESFAKKQGHKWVLSDGYFFMGTPTHFRYLPDPPEPDAADAQQDTVSVPVELLQELIELLDEAADTTSMASQAFAAGSSEWADWKRKINHLKQMSKNIDSLIEVGDG